ncbi:MAG: uroporphyrinogen-III synthase [Chitinophagaceae bacterium]
MLKKQFLDLAAQHQIQIIDREFIQINSVFPNVKLAKKISSLCQEQNTILFTSKNAVNAVKSYLNEEIGRNYSPPWKYFCLDTATQKELLDSFADVQDIIGTSNSGASLAEEILLHSKIRKVYFFCGNKRRNDLPDTLRLHDIEVEEIIVYENIPQPQTVPGPWDAILFFSPTAVESYLSLNSPGLRTICFAIGNTTANVIAEHLPNKIVICPNPSMESMINQVIQYFKNK